MWRRRIFLSAATESRTARVSVYSHASNHVRWSAPSGPAISCSPDSSTHLVPDCLLAVGQPSLVAGPVVAADSERLEQGFGPSEALAKRVLLLEVLVLEVLERMEPVAMQRGVQPSMRLDKQP